LLDRTKLFDQPSLFVSALIFDVDEDGRLPPHVTYKIRQNASFTQNTKSIRLSFWRPDPFAWDMRYYIVSIRLFVKYCIIVITNILQPSSFDNLNVHNLNIKSNVYNLSEVFPSSGNNANHKPHKNLA